MSYMSGVGLTSYGKHGGSSSLSLMSQAAALAISNAGLKRADIDEEEKASSLVCNPSDLRGNSLKGVPTARNYRLKSIWLFGYDLSEVP
jgi:hypothetical protein